MFGDIDKKDNDMMSDESFGAEKREKSNSFEYFAEEDHKEDKKHILDKPTTKKL